MRFLPLILLISSTAFAQSSAQFSIKRGVVASGGTTFSSSARFKMGGTIAQPLAAVPISARFSIHGGFWIWPSPILFAPVKSGTNFVFGIQSELGKRYTLQYKNSLTSIWQDLTNISGTGGIVTATTSALLAPQGFFRLVERP